VLKYSSAVVQGWRVDPDRVVGVLAGIDDDGAKLASTPKRADELYLAHASLRVDGRATVAHAWGGFLEERRRVPGALIGVLASSAEALTEATVAVVSGDELMAADFEGAEASALERWGIDSILAYGGGSF
jgi:hypothetical protein